MVRIMTSNLEIEQQQQDMEKVFCRLQAAGLVINFEKSIFTMKVDFLGHRVFASIFAPLLSWMAAI
jgi:hypothetical protein